MIGLVHAVDELAQVPKTRTAGEVLYHNVWVKEGDKILLPPKHFSRQLMGYVVVSGDSYAEVDEKLKRCAALFRITVAEESQA